MRQRAARVSSLIRLQSHLDGHIRVRSHNLAWADRLRDCNVNVTALERDVFAGERTIWIRISDVVIGLRERNIFSVICLQRPGFERLALATRNHAQRGFNRNCELIILRDGRTRALHARLSGLESHGVARNVSQVGGLHSVDFTHGVLSGRKVFSALVVTQQQTREASRSTWFGIPAAKFRPVMSNLSKGPPVKSESLANGLLLG